MFAVWGTTIASPSRAKWIREELIGASDTHYFVLVEERDYPGNYYDWSERMSIRRVRVDAPSDMETVLLTEAFHSLDVTRPDSQWQTTFRRQPSFDLASYLHDNRVGTVFSSTVLADIVVKDGALYAAGGGSTILLLSEEALKKQVPDLGLDPRIVGCREALGFAFFSVQFNEDSSDDSWSEKLLVVPLTRLGEAVGALRRLQKTK